MQLHTSSALDLADHIHRREVSSEEVVRFFLARARRLNPEIFAFVDLFEQRAILTARLKDKQRSQAAFHGVPIAVKDLNFVRGTFARMGSRAFQYLFSPFDDVNVASLRRSGMVVMGKVTTSELGVLPVTEPDTHPPTRNPWNRQHTPGGSSGGSGAAVAANLVPFAHGSDGGGSVRIPASLCGLFGFKPSRNRLPYPNANIRQIGLSTSGALAHSVEDGAALYDVMCGMDSREAIVARRERRRNLVGKKQLRIRLITQSPIAKTDPALEEAARQTGRVLASLGHIVEEVSMPPATLDEFMPLWAGMISRIPLASTSLMQAATRWVASQANGLSIDAVVRHRNMLAARVLGVVEGADFVLTPTVAIEPPRIGQCAGLSGEETFRSLAPLGVFTAPFNITGQPAASIPAGLSPQGLPMGVQIAGHVGADDDVLALALQLEEAMPWARRGSPMATA